jgi:hypothetical protein
VTNIQNRQEDFNQIIFRLHVPQKSSLPHACPKVSASETRVHPAARGYFNARNLVHDRLFSSLVEGGIRSNE